jgi:hypothetical protein
VDRQFTAPLYAVTNRLIGVFETVREAARELPVGQAEQEPAVEMLAH